MKVEMTKAYDLKAYVEFVKVEAKKKGLTIAEEAVEEFAASMYLGTKAWLKASALMTENKIDDVMVGFTDYADPYVLPEIKAIDLDGDGQ